MNLFSATELIDRVRFHWGLAGYANFAALEALFLEHPAAARRIHDILYLTRDESAIQRWFHEPLANGLTPLQFLANGAPGLRRLESILISEFRRAAPPEIFANPSSTRDPALEATVLDRLIYERVDSGKDPKEVLIYDPLLASDAPVPNHTIRIARAISRLASEFDGPALRHLLELAALDPSKEICKRVAHAAAGLVGHPSMADLLVSFRTHPDPEVRMMALGGLLPFARRLEMHARIAPYARDVVKKIRLDAFEALAPQDLPPEIRSSLIGLAWDPDPEIRARARSVFSEDELSSRLEDLCAEAAAGAQLEVAELRVIAAETMLSAERRVEVFQRRFATLEAAFEASASDLVDTVQALGAWPGELPAPLWTSIARVAQYGLPEFEVCLLRLVKDPPVEKSWPALATVLRLPVPPKGASIRTELALRAVALAQGAPQRLSGLVALVSDPDVDEDARSRLLWAFVRLDENPKTLAVLRRVLVVDGPALRKTALKVLRALADPIEAVAARALLRWARRTLRGEDAALAARYWSEIVAAHGGPAAAPPDRAAILRARRAALARQRREEEILSRS